LDADRISEVLF